MTIFMTTHYMDEAEICDKVAIIDHGKIVAFDTPSYLKRMHTSDIVKIKTSDGNGLREFQGTSDCEELQAMISPLSNREASILELLYRGLNITQLADQLCISPHTVQTHIKKIYSKLHVNTRSQAIYEAVKMKLIRS